MCVQINNLFTCGHRSFKRFDNCPRFGQACLGAGSNHRDESAAKICKDCLFREEHLQGGSATPDGGTPDSSGSGGGGGGVEARKDPWWDGDPWRRYRRG